MHRAFCARFSVEVLLRLRFRAAFGHEVWVDPWFFSASARTPVVKLFAKLRCLFRVSLGKVRRFTEIISSVVEFDLVDLVVLQQLPVNPSQGADGRVAE